MKRKKVCCMFVLFLLINLCACGDTTEIMEDFKDNVDVHSIQATGKTLEDNISDVIEEIDEIVKETDFEQKVENEADISKGILNNEENTTQVKNNETKRYVVGDTVSLRNYDETKNEETANVTITDCGIIYDEFYGELVYAHYEIQNTSDGYITVGNGMFNVYADNYMLEQFVLKDDVIYNVELSGGRQLSGTIYVELNPENVSTIEIECGDVIWVLKEPTPIVEVEMIPESMIRDAEAIPYEDMAGEYVGITGLYAAFSMYSAIEDEYVGNVEMQLTDRLKGKLVHVDTNVYQIITSDGSVILLGVYRDNENIGMDMYVDGQQFDYLIMTSPFIS